MDEVVITVRDNGPYKVTGPATLTDAEGNQIPIPEGRPLVLCRCGASEAKPMCDATHRRIGFASVIRAPVGAVSETR
jgi:CDGSH iron-sulfur domain-containing protein 3